MQKKLLRYPLEVEELSKRVTRIWIKGTDNVLGDAPSRNPKDRDTVKHLAVPAGPVKRIVRAMFEKPIELDEEITAMQRFLQEMQSDEPSAELTADDRDSTNIKFEESAEPLDKRPDVPAESVEQQAVAEGNTGAMVTPQGGSSIALRQGGSSIALRQTEHETGGSSVAHQPSGPSIAHRQTDGNKSMFVESLIVQKVAVARMKNHGSI